MATAMTAHAVGNAEAAERCALLSSSDSELPVSTDGLADPNETAPTTPDESPTSTVRILGQKYRVVTCCSLSILLLRDKCRR